MLFRRTEKSWGALPLCLAESAAGEADLASVPQGQFCCPCVGSFPNLNLLLCESCLQWEKISTFSPKFPIVAKAVIHSVGGHSYPWAGLILFSPSLAPPHIPNMFWKSGLWTEGKRDLWCTGPFPEMTAMAGAGQSHNLEFHSSLPGQCRGLRIWDIIFCFPEYVRREPDGKWRSWDLRQCSCETLALQAAG